LFVDKSCFYHQLWFELLKPPLLLLLPQMMPLPPLRMLPLPLFPLQ
jgi:hypothetical protein